MEKLLGRQRDSLKKQKESVKKKKAELEERSREMDVAKAALDTRRPGHSVPPEPIGSVLRVLYKFGT